MEMHYHEPESEVRFRSVRFRSVRFRSVRFRSKQTVTQGKPPYRSVSWYLIFKFVLPYNSIIFYLNTFTRTARKLSMAATPGRNTNGLFTRSKANTIVVDEDFIILYLKFFKYYYTGYGNLPDA